MNYQAILGSVFSRGPDCKLCPLNTPGKTFVPGIGVPNAELMLVGEGPGAKEDEEGLPFIGPAGQALQQILTDDLGLSLKTLWVTNTAKHQPPGNRTPTWDEASVCYQHFLGREIEMVKPRAIVCLGRAATETLMRISEEVIPKGTVRGRQFLHRGIPTIATWHPSYLIRNGSLDDHSSKAYQLRTQVVDDIQLIRKNSEVYYGT